MAGDVANVIQVQPARQQEPSLSNLANAQLIPQMSGEGYKLVDRLIDPNAIYLDKLTAFLYNAHLQKSSIPDPESPIPGYKLLKIGGKKWRPNMNQDGYSTASSEILMALAEDGSITRFPNDFKLQFFCARQTMAIICMMCTNREDWEFTNYSIIYSFGLTMWKAMVATLSRSRAEPGKRTMLDLLIHPNLWFTQNEMPGEKPKSKWFNI